MDKKEEYLRQIFSKYGIKEEEQDEIIEDLRKLDEGDLKEDDKDFMDKINKDVDAYNRGEWDK